MSDEDVVYDGQPSMPTPSDSAGYAAGLFGSHADKVTQEQERMKRENEYVKEKLETTRKTMLELLDTQNGVHFLESEKEHQRKERRKSSMAYKKMSKEDKLTKKIETRFNRYCSATDGITKKRFEDLLEDMCIPKSQLHSSEAFESMDVNQNGEINFTEFQKWYENHNTMQTGIVSKMYTGLLKKRMAFQKKKRSIMGDMDLKVAHQELIRRSCTLARKDYQEEFRLKFPQIIELNEAEMGDLGMLTGYDTDATDSEYIDGLPDGAVGASKDSEERRGTINLEEAKVGEKKNLLNRLNNIPEEGILFVVHIVNATDLCVMDTAHFVGKGSSDPYVKVLLGTEEVGRSEHRLKNLNPRWDYHLKFVLPMGSMAETVTFALFDKDLISADDPMGIVEISVEKIIEVTSSGDFTGTLERPIMACVGCMKASGKLMFKMETQAAEPIPESALAQKVAADAEVAAAEAELEEAKQTGNQEDVSRVVASLGRARANATRADTLLERVEEQQDAELEYQRAEAGGDEVAITAALHKLAVAKEAVKHAHSHDILMDKRDEIDANLQGLEDRKLDEKRRASTSRESSGFCCW